MTWTFTDEMKIWTAMDPDLLAKIVESTKDFEDHYHRLAITRDTHDTARAFMNTDRVDSRVSKRNITLREAGCGSASQFEIRTRLDRTAALFQDQELARQLIEWHMRGDNVNTPVPERLLPFLAGEVVDRSYYQNALSSVRGLSLPVRPVRDDDAERQRAAREEWKARYKQPSGGRGWEFRTIRHIGNNFHYDFTHGMEFHLVVEYVQSISAGPTDDSPENIQRVLEDNHKSRATATNDHRVQAFEEIDPHGNVKLAEWVLEFMDNR